MLIKYCKELIVQETTIGLKIISFRLQQITFEVIAAKCEATENSKSFHKQQSLQFA